MFGVTILGNNSALPAFDRHPTAQVITLNDQLILIDCGEGTQMQMSRYKIRRSKINHIFISHLHGDHYFGIAGLVTSMGLLNREQDLHIYAPAPLKELLCMQLNIADTKLPFALHFHSTADEGIIVDEEKFTVECFHVKHRIPCTGFIIREKRNARKINIDAVSKFGVPVSFYENLQKGNDFITSTGEIITNEHLTFANTTAKSYAFSADTIYDETIAQKVAGVHMLYHETTYLKNLESRAASRFHSTTVQAANIATLANTNKLLIGHFSSKYEQLDEFLNEASEVFANVQLAIEGVTYLV